MRMTDKDKDEESVEVMIKGLDNLGNTCYMNSSLQALYATGRFTKYILSRKQWLDQKPMHDTIRKLFTKMNSNDKHKSIEPKYFWKVFTQFKPQFHDRLQHDAQEFLRYIIDDIHEEVNAAAQRRKKLPRGQQLEEAKDGESAWKQFRTYTDDSLLVKMFVGQMRSTIKCSECSYESHRWECFWDLSLPLPDNDDECQVIDCVKLYQADEVLDADSMIMCPKCAVKRTFSKKYMFEKLPPILMIQLKKFGNDGNKLHKSVAITDSLSLSASGPQNYSLYACVSHRGYSCSSGHYISHCKHRDKWYLFDDEDVTPIEDMDFGSLSNAYILFYRRRSQ